MNLYVISIVDSAGRQQSYNILAANRGSAETKARELAGVASDVEPTSSQKMLTVNAVVA